MKSLEMYWTDSLLNKHILHNKKYLFIKKKGKKYNIYVEFYFYEEYETIKEEKYIF